ncbi:MAG TPA: hypothetical protein PK743_01735 [Luteimonas sp.]|nr:hypothetical protein [Luteimonas sp.]HRO26406.1 hypothetical protein [Luteimonas sp.]HRP71341.1 hypothetical protein [Luteimonas sp.]
MKTTWCLIVLLWPACALAQSSAENCPELPAGSGLDWDVTENTGFVYCKAIRDNGSQAFAVMLRAESSFRGERQLREEEGVIDGHKVRWYRSEIVLQPGMLVRETLVGLGRRSTAHIVVRATSEDQLADNRRLAEGLRFRNTALGGD